MNDDIFSEKNGKQKEMTKCFWRSFMKKHFDSANLLEKSGKKVMDRELYQQKDQWFFEPFLKHKTIFFFKKPTKKIDKRNSGEGIMTDSRKKTENKHVWANKEKWRRKEATTCM